MILSEKTVRDVARLARLGLSEEEIPTFQKDLSGILDFFGELEAYSLEEEPHSGALRPARFGRADSELSTSAETQENLRKNFPSSKDAYLKVRSVF